MNALLTILIYMVVFCIGSSFGYFMFLLLEYLFSLLKTRKQEVDQAIQEIEDYKLNGGKSR